MASASDFPARGKVKEVGNGGVVFLPLNTNYQLHCQVAGGEYAGPVGERVEAVVRVVGKKIWTVPSGGNFIAPIFGPPRTIQGRVRYLDNNVMVVQAGTMIVVELPKDETAYDLVTGPLAVGGLVNVLGLPGATFELLGVEAAG